MATITEIVTEVGWVSIGKQHRATIMGMEAVVAMTEVKVATAMVGAMVITVMAMIGVITIIILEDLGVGMADDVLKLLLCLIIWRSFCLTIVWVFQKEKRLCLGSKVEGRLCKVDRSVILEFSTLYM